jgi:DNA-3-methyladenine glycosylase I
VSDALASGPDGRPRCWWAVSAPEYVDYHDREWGRPVHDARALYEKLCLEAFQSGLSWITILRKREGFRAAFAGFDPALVARFGAEEVERLMADAAIVRNRAKIEATIANARAALDVDLSALIWSFAPPPRARPRDRAAVPAVTDESKALAKALKRHGFKFVGPTTAYALMQACGVVDDHIEGCCVQARNSSATKFDPTTASGSDRSRASSTASANAAGRSGSAIDSMPRRSS